MALAVTAGGSRKEFDEALTEEAAAGKAHGRVHRSSLHHA
jgi:hypothetical protein